MTAIYSTIKLYNTGAGIEAILTDNRNYSLLNDSWSPNVAGDRPDQSGGRPFNRVVENITLEVKGGTRAQALENLNNLVRLLKLAEEWRNDMTANITTTPTIFQWEPQGSTGGPWEAVVVGRVDKTRNYLSLPVKFHEDMVLYTIHGVKLEFVREGEWLGETETTSASVAAATGDLMTVSFANDISIPSPTKLVVEGLGSAASPSNWSNLIVAYSEDDIRIVKGSDLTDASFVNDAANNPLGDSGFVAQVEGSSSYDSTIILFGTPIQHKTVAVYAVLRNNSSSASWSVYVETREVSTQSNGTTRVTVVDASTDDPRVHFLGTIQSARKLHNYGYFYWKSTVKIVPPTLDIDCFVFVGMDNPVNQVMKLLTPGDITSFTVDPRQLSAPSPIVTGDESYSCRVERGNPYVISNGNQLSAVWLAPRANYWRWSNNIGTLQELTLTAERQTAVLIPE